MESFREILLDEFECRKQRRPEYSLRAFSRDLGLPPTRMSDVIGGRQGLSRKVAAQISLKLRFSMERAQYFCDLVDAEHARKKSQRTEAQNRLTEMGSERKLELQDFQKLSQWFGFAVLALKSAQPELKSQEVARRLGISVTQAEETCQKLYKLGLLNHDPRLVTTGKDIPSEAIRSYHREVLEKAQTALETQGVDIRDFSSVNFLVDPSRLTEMKKDLKTLRRKFMKKYESPSPSAELYALSMQFFSLENQTGKADS